MNLVIEVNEISDGNFEAKLVDGSASVKVTENFNVSCKGYSVDDASLKLRIFLTALGYKGSFEVRYIEVKTYPAEEEHKEEACWIASDTFSCEGYNVTFKKTRDPQYMCECRDFIHRRLHLKEHCKHIDRAITFYGLGV